MSDDVTSVQLVPAARQPTPEPQSEGWGDEATLTPQRTPLERPLAAIRRYKWLMMAVFTLCVAGGAIATRFVKPEYGVTATIWIASETPLSNRDGPIRSHELLQSSAWVELLKSYRISDQVVRKLSLYVKPKDDADSTVLKGFSVVDQFLPGVYNFKVEKRVTRWHLTRENDGVIVSDSGTVGDSVGRDLGFRWLPTAATLAKVAGKEVRFTVSTPRETSMDLQKRLTPKLALGSNFLWLTLTDPNSQLAARILNTWVTEYVAVAADLKKRNTVEFANVLSGQLSFAEKSLHDAESALETFRVKTITLPTESGSPVVAGLEMTRDPVLRGFFEKKIEFDNIHHDREALERVIAANSGGSPAAAASTPWESVLLIPSVVQLPGGEELRQSFQRLLKEQADLNAARQIYTDAWPAVRDLSGSVNTLKTKTIPQQASALLVQLKQREGDFDSRVKSQSTDLQSIPQRTIEEMRLRRAVAVTEQLYTTLKNRTAEAQLAEASAAPDVNILDSAIAPLKPTKNTTPGIIAIGVVAGLGLAVGLALLLDGLDKRLRYPEQATKDLGLVISGTVPQLPKGGLDRQSPEQISQLIESFRTLRMSVMNSGAGAQLALAVSSPSPGDGKSFISSNLAMSFADAGFRTLLVDGDTRRGALHEMFGLPRADGLTDFLAGEAGQGSIIYPTGHDNLSLIPTGRPRRRSPELLTSPALVKLVHDLRKRYDVVIFDTPPLAAGVDGYAVAAATGNLLVVLRIGQTERRMAAAKMLLVDRLPINVIGSVLNAAPSKGEYEYYGYAGGYGTEELEPGREVAQIS